MIHELPNCSLKINFKGIAIKSLNYMYCYFCFILLLIFIESRLQIGRAFADGCSKEYVEGNQNPKINSEYLFSICLCLFSLFYRVNTRRFVSSSFRYISTLIFMTFDYNQAHILTFSLVACKYIDHTKFA